MHKVVIDTNVFVSGVITKGLSSKVLDLWRKRKFKLAVSLDIIEEINAVLHRPRIKEKYKIPEVLIKKLILSIYENSISTAGRIAVKKINADPSDNKFLACALEENVDYIVSGDGHLLNLKSFQGIKIVDVKTFLKLL